jgi:hypothetical protein
MGSTNPPFENSFLKEPRSLFTHRRKTPCVRRSTSEFDGVSDLDKVVPDPTHPTRVLPGYDSRDHLHPNYRG